MGMDYERCKCFLEDIGIEAYYDYKVSKWLRCDFYGLSKENHIIIERKASVGDLQKGLWQILKYYHGLTKLKVFSKYPRPTKLYIWYDLYDGAKRMCDGGHYGALVEVYENYIKNPNCPPIEFYYGHKKWGKNPKNVIIRTQEVEGVCV